MYVSLMCLLTFIENRSFFKFHFGASGETVSLFFFLFAIRSNQLVN